MNDCSKIKVFEDKAMRRDKEHQQVVELNLKTITKHELLRQITKKVHGIKLEDTEPNGLPDILRDSRVDHRRQSSSLM